MVNSLSYFQWIKTIFTLNATQLLLGFFFGCFFVFVLKRWDYVSGLLPSDKKYQDTFSKVPLCIENI